ncbi:hypothetical protein ASPVEDRAFT_33513 [Aspergillus versicolor CBS 583.65]|uniref:Uncharacterized protein n=1 Tax=Aspergillus versicolor CBS 583.65 TaxID=1036611 RepID=A0A1L9Q0J6_ASPVE|nr:uncharacterized protein ASPVEDRAFT_33513 [Aspergillus versicolor CBS 583.65]OJJ07283.1 hypothetical protein ASPVEDRAFT_33513 [Aspergillus versicolor CBS 583.65]
MSSQAVDAYSVDHNESHYGVRPEKARWIYPKTKRAPGAEQGARRTHRPPEREGSVYEAVPSREVDTTGSAEVTDLSQRPLQSPENSRALRVETTPDGEVVDNARAVTDANEHTRHIERVHTESGTTKEKGLSLQAAWSECVAVRRRFLATYKRDKKEWTKHDRKIINTGNQAVQDGTHPNDTRYTNSFMG